MSKVTILTKPNRIVIASKGVQGPPGPQGEGISDAPDDGGAYIRVNGQWVQLYAPIALAGDLPDGTVDEPYSATLIASGGRPPYALGDVLLPPGLDATLSDAAVTVAGTPSEEWDSEAHIDLSDSLGSAIRRVFDVEVDVAPNALSPAKQAIETGAGDVNLLVLGDSTGDAANEWVYLFAELVAAEYPSHSVLFRGYSYANGYGEWEAISTGSGPNTIYFHNASVSLSRPKSLMGSGFQTAVGSIPQIDLVIWNYGHNITSSFLRPTIHGEFVAPVEMVSLAHPNAPHCYVLQNPRRDDDTQDAKILALQDMAAIRGDLALVDFYSHWVSAGKPPAWYADNIHPNEIGSAENAAVFFEAWSGASAAPFDPLPARLTETAPNLLSNGDFSSWDGAVPDSWSMSGAASVEKDTVLVDGASAYSARVFSDSGGYMTQALSPAARAALAGKKITLSVRMRADTSTPTSGSVLLQVNSTFIQSVAGSDDQSGDAFRWQVIADVQVPESVTAISVRLPAAQSAVAGAFTNYDRVVLVEGSNPRDME